MGLGEHIRSKIRAAYQPAPRILEDVFAYPDLEGRHSRSGRPAVSARLAETAPKFTRPTSTRMRILEVFPRKSCLAGCEAGWACEDAWLADAVG